MGHKVQSKHNSDIVAKISGFRPATIGRICDMSNALAQEGENVHVEMEIVEGEWEFCRMHKKDTPLELTDSHPEAVQAIVDVEVLNINDMFASIGNPTVLDVSPKGEARGEWKEILE